jgi:hypothetical protein
MARGEVGANRSIYLALIFGDHPLSRASLRCVAGKTT